MIQLIKLLFIIKDYCHQSYRMNGVKNGYQGDS
jgi:hypothetical protein